MIASKAYQTFYQALLPVYEEREAQSMTKIVFEDAFKIYETNAQKELDDKQTKRLVEIQNRLLKNEPLQYILGEADFYGLRFKVDQNVLIPRAETEELVYWILEDLKLTTEPAPKVLDIGTGSGCIPITLKKENDALSVCGIDISMGAINVAIENAVNNDVVIDFLELDILDETSWGKIPYLDIIVSNPPYIPHQEATLMPKNVLEFEPAIALFVENEDPLIFYSKIASMAKLKLKEKGALYFELNEHNAQKVKTMLEAKGFQSVEIKKDMSGKDRMIKATLGV